MSEKTPRRKLAAILAADVVGFSKLMGDNEERAFKNLRACRALTDAAIKENHGRIFHTAGDSVLAEFGSAVDTMVAAVEFQRNLKNRNDALEEEEEMHFRVGLNIGDVIIEGDNLYGDGVNIAARLEASAEKGGISLSGKFHDEVARKLEIGFVSTGEQEMKNIATPVKTFKVEISNLKNTGKNNQINEENSSIKSYNTGSGSNVVIEPNSTINTSNADKPPAIAVLPFANMSGDAEQEYFADGMTEDIITNLSLWKTFPVISRNSSFTYKGKNVNMKEVAIELGVRYIVEGSVRKGGNKVRITAQLIDASEDHHLWSNRWDRSLDDIFEVQDEVSQAIAAVVSPAVKEQEGKRVVKKQTKNVNAWDEYLRGLSCYNNREGSDKVKEHCYKSIELDPKISDNYVLLCNAGYNDIFNHEKQDKRKELENDFHKNAQIAFDLDSENPEAIIVLSRSHNLKKEYDKRLSLMEKAVSINPNHAAANFDYGLALTNTKQFEKAKEHVQKALELSPSGSDRERFKTGGLWLISIGLKDYEEAIKNIEYMLEKNPGFTGAYGFLASIKALQGKIDEAKVALAKYCELRPKIKNLSDYEKVAPTIIKDILLEGLEKAGLPK